MNRNGSVYHFLNANTRETIRPLWISARSKSTPASASLVHEGDRVVATSADDPVSRDPLDLTFSDHEAAFKSKSNLELLRAVLVFQLCSIKPLVENNDKVCLCDVSMKRSTNRDDITEEKRHLMFSS